MQDLSIYLLTFVSLNKMRRNCAKVVAKLFDYIILN